MTDAAGGAALRHPDPGPREQLRETQEAREKFAGRVC